jgi:hypothetical protein
LPEAVHTAECDHWSGKGSPHYSFAVLQPLGVAQWFAQIPRWHFAVFQAVYSFQRRIPQDGILKIDSTCLSELLCFAALSGLLVADLERDFVPILATCDASPSYGFGVSVRSCSTELLQELSACAERHGDYLRMTVEEGDEGEASHWQPCTSTIRPKLIH